jgi:hypothetical protein
MWLRQRRKKRAFANKKMKMNFCGVPDICMNKGEGFGSGWIKKIP